MTEINIFKEKLFKVLQVSNVVETRRQGLVDSIDFDTHEPLVTLSGHGIFEACFPDQDVQINETGAFTATSVKGNLHHFIASFKRPITQSDFK